MIQTYQALQIELSKSEVKVVSSVDIFDLLGIPASVHFNDFSAPAEYKHHLESLFKAFQTELVSLLEKTDSDQNQLNILSEIHFEQNELLQDFHQKEIIHGETESREVHDQGENEVLNKITIPANVNTRFISGHGWQNDPFVEVKVSEFLELQKAVIEKLIRYIDLKKAYVESGQSHSEKATEAKFMTALTLLIENMEGKDQKPSSSRFATNGSRRGQHGDTAPIQKIKWNDTPQAFVETFAKLINDRKLILKGENDSDCDPIVRLLQSFISIPKTKGKGEISPNSLGTYFKNYNADQEK